MMYEIYEHKFNYHEVYIYGNTTTTIKFRGDNSLKNAIEFVRVQMVHMGQIGE